MNGMDCPPAVRVPAGGTGAGLDEPKGGLYWSVERPESLATMPARNRISVSAK
jgi:hypothetical protein